MNLPIEFEEKMQDLLGGEYNDYLKCYEEPRHYGLRVNTSKISIDRFLEIAPWPLRPIPWIENGFYYDAEKEKISSVDNSVIQPEVNVTKAEQIGIYYIYNNQGNDICMYNSRMSYTSGYLLAEYPENIEDDVISNLNMNPEYLEILENTCFKNNAILNRLICTDTSEWMKVVAPSAFAAGTR